MTDNLKFEADLIAWPKWPKYSRGIWAILFLLSFVWIICEGIYSTSTGGLVSSTLLYSFGLLLLLFIVFAILAAIYGLQHKVIGRMTIDGKQITTFDKTFVLDSLESITLTILSYKGQKYSSEASDGDGANFISVKQYGQEFEYAFIVKSERHMAELSNFMVEINHAVKRELFVESYSVFGQLNAKNPRYY